MTNRAYADETLRPVITAMAPRRHYFIVGASIKVLQDISEEGVIWRSCISLNKLCLLQVELSSDLD